MRKILFILAMVLTFGTAAPVASVVPEAAAQTRSGDLSGALARLKNNPRYAGQIIGTQIRRTGGRSLYEVQVLRRDDSVIVVYIDPRTGGVIGDSERGGRNGTNRLRNNQRNAPRGNR